MDTNDNIFGIQTNEWTIYVIGILVFIILFFIQKYSYLIDRKLSEKYKLDKEWEGHPWPLLSGLLLGFIVFVLGVFLPGELSSNPVNWQWPELLIFVFALAIIVMLAIESFIHFGKSVGSLRLVIFGVLSFAFFYAGMLAGLFLAAILALTIIIYFLFFLKKRLGIK